MTLAIGQKVFSEAAQVELVVKKKLGEGAQGVVFLVEGPQGSQAVKWYVPRQATAEQKAAILYLVGIGPPRGPAGRRFIWPQDLVTAEGIQQFGYLMPLIDTNRFADLGEVWARRKPAPGLDVLCEISFQISNTYRTLHLSGHCYRDISLGNLMFDPITGDVLICDNDNVGVNCQSSFQVWGTMPYMAPELIRGEVDHPSTETDLHSLAVLLFQLWVWHHPLHGTMEYDVRCWDDPARRKIYGLTPVFIFDPTDDRNRLPNDPTYAVAAQRWALCPQSLHKLFENAFTVGLRSPARRVTEGEWQSLFLQLKDGAIACPSCHAISLWEPGQTSLTCWNPRCRKPMAIPPRLVFSLPGGTHHVLLTRGAEVLRRHIDPTCPLDDASDLLGHMKRNPNNPNVWGLCNLTATPWSATAADGKTIEVPPQKSVPLATGLKVNIGGTIGDIVA